MQYYLEAIGIIIIAALVIVIIECFRRRVERVCCGCCRIVKRWRWVYIPLCWRCFLYYHRIKIAVISISSTIGVIIAIICKIIIGN
jgi:hypothetical protein